MSKKIDHVAAIDIGTTKIVAITGRKNENGRLEVLGMSSTPSRGVKRGVVLNIEETVNAIRTVVNETRARSGINFREVFVGIAGQHIRSVRNRGYLNRDSLDDEITREDIFTLLEEMRKIPVDVGEEILHVLPQSFIVDNETGVKNPVGMSGRRLEGNFHIVVGQTASARNIEKCVRRVGLDIHQLILEPLASSEAVLTDDEKEAGVALVDIGGGTTDVAVYFDDIIRHTAVIPFGGNVVTNDIKEGCSILHKTAESLKIQFGSALGDIAQEDKVVTIPGISGREPKEISFKSLAYIIQSRMEEIIDAVTFEIENSGYLDKLSAGLVITGGGAMLRHLPQLVKFRTGLDVRVGLPCEHLSGDLDQEVNQAMYSTSVGLVLKGYEFMEQKAAEEVMPHEEEPETGKPEEAPKSGGKKLLIRWKDALNDIFEEKDASM